MDVYEEADEAPQKQRPPLVPSDKNNDGTFIRRARTREVSSRYRSPTPSRRFPSPNTPRIPTTPTQSLPKRSQSADRKRPSPPHSPRGPSTPVQDSSIEVAQLSSRRLSTGRLPESLWPCTMRSLSVSFQSDTISIPISRREKSVAATALSDRTLNPSSNVPRKPTPERKRSPLKGKNVSNQLENSKPVDGLNPRLVDQHRWPSRTGGKMSSNVLSRSVDLSDRASKASSLPSSGIGISSLRRTQMPETMSKPLQKSRSDTAKLASFDDSKRLESRVHSVEHCAFLRVSNKQTPSSSSERITLTTPATRSQGLPDQGSRPPSPSMASTLSVSASRGMVSPSRTRPSTPALSRGVSPSRSRPSSPAGRAINSTSVLTFIADIRKGKKSANHVEDAHQLKLLYNSYLQWRFANAEADGVLYIQKVVAEKTLCNVWRTLLALWDSVTNKRISLQQLTLKLKLDMVLNEQMTYLDDWASIERDHSSSLSGAIEDLQASTLRLPVTTGARADMETVKATVCSAVDVMRAIGTSMCSLLSRVEGMSYVVSELADLAAQGRALLDACEALLASTAAMQIEEYSLKTHLMQLRTALREG